MSNAPITPPGSRRIFSLAICVAIGIFIGLMCGLSLARRLVPAPTESRLVMQLLALEHETATMQARTGRCEPLSPARASAVESLVELVTPSLRDALVVDEGFERKVEHLRQAVRDFNASPRRDCVTHRRMLAAIDSACRDCHQEYRSGEAR